MHYYTYMYVMQLHIILDKESLVIVKGRVNTTKLFKYSNQGLYLSWSIKSACGAINVFSSIAMRSVSSFQECIKRVYSHRVIWLGALGSYPTVAHTHTHTQIYRMCAMRIKISVLCLLNLHCILIAKKSQRKRERESEREKNGWSYVCN